MRSSPGTRRGLALACLIAGLLIAAWNWHRLHRTVPPATVASLPAPARTLIGAPRAVATELADPPVDPVFGQQARTPWLRRQVEMYQVDPASPEGRSRRWADHLLDKDAAPPRDFPIASADFFAGVAQLDGRWLSHQAIRAMGPGQRLTPRADAVPQNMLASFGVSGDYLISSDDPEHPQPGDLRVSWTAQAWPPAGAGAIGAGAIGAGPAPVQPGADPAPLFGGWRPVATYLLAAVLLLIAAGLGLGWRRPR